MRVKGPDLAQSFNSVYNYETSKQYMNYINKYLKSHTSLEQKQ